MGERAGNYRSISHFRNNYDFRGMKGLHRFIPRKSLNFYIAYYQGNIIVKVVISPS